MKRRFPFWTLALRNLSRRPRRTVLSMTAVGLASLTMVLLFSLVAGLKADLAANLQRYSTGKVLVEDRGMTRAGAHALTLAIPEVSSLVDRLARVAGVSDLAPRVTGAASVFADGDAVFFPFMGLGADDPLDLEPFLLPGGSVPVPGERHALVSTGLADKLGLKVGDTLTAVTQTLRGSSNGITFTVTGIVKPPLAAYAAPWLFTSVETARRFVHLGDGATSLLIGTVPGADPEQVAAGVQSVLDAGGRAPLTARPWNRASSSYGLIQMAEIVYAFLGLLFAALASTVVINSMLMVVLERSKEIGMLGALGMDPADLRTLFLVEGALLAGGGALAGTLAGSVLALVLGVTGLDYSDAMKGVDLEMSSVLRPVLEPLMPLGVFFLSVAVALVFTLVPVHRLRAMVIVDALRGEI